MSTCGSVCLYLLTMAAPGLFFEPSLRIKQQQSSDNSSGPGRIWPPSPPALPDLIVCMLHVMCPLADSIYSLFSHVRAPSVTLFIRFFLISIFQHWGRDYCRFFFPIPLSINPDILAKVASCLCVSSFSSSSAIDDRVLTFATELSPESVKT